MSTGVVNHARVLGALIVSFPAAYVVMQVSTLLDMLWHVMECLQAGKPVPPPPVFGASAARRFSVAGADANARAWPPATGNR